MDTRKKLGLGALGAAAGAAALSYGTAKLLNSKVVINARKRLMIKGNKLLSDLKETYHTVSDGIASKLGLERHQLRLQPVGAGNGNKYNNAFLNAPEKHTFQDTLNHSGVDVLGKYNNTNLSVSRPVRSFGRHH